jgi:predicted dithiol-disulfide oxidoreductase (DUF899 family)
LIQLRDRVVEERQRLPWVRIHKSYQFEGADGTLQLHNLFAGCSQLIVYHFMFGPDWEEGCPMCSFWADSFNGVITHLRHRDVPMQLLSRASSMSNVARQLFGSFGDDCDTLAVRPR